MYCCTISYNFIFLRFSNYSYFQIIFAYYNTLKKFWWFVGFYAPAIQIDFSTQRFQHIDTVVGQRVKVLKKLNFGLCIWLRIWSLHENSDEILEGVQDLSAEAHDRNFSQREYVTVYTYFFRKVFRNTHTHKRGYYNKKIYFYFNFKK